MCSHSGTNISYCVPGSRPAGIFGRLEHLSRKPHRAPRRHCRVKDHEGDALHARLLTWGLRPLCESVDLLKIIVIKNQKTISYSGSYSLHSAGRGMDRCCFAGVSIASQGFVLKLPSCGRSSKFCPRTVAEK